MKVILNQNVDSLGSVGSVVEVRDGYARNYLIPSGFAVVATDSNVKMIAKVKAKEIQKEKEKKVEAEKYAKKVSAESYTLEVLTGEDEKLFGSVTTADIAKLLSEKGFEIDKKSILLKKPIKAVGAYQIEITCHPEVRAEIKLWVVKKKS